MGEIVSYSVVDGVAVVRIDNPPVNAMDRAVRAGLEKTFSDLKGRPEIKAIVLGCAGRTFVAGADIKEFDSGIGKPGFHEVLRLIEDSACPVVAAVHGTALGAGTELALACHYRVADKNARFGLPELSLGIIPGAGGTQRLPRIVALSSALDMILSGKPVAAAAAREMGLADAVVEGDVIDGAVSFARELAAKGAGPRRTREQPVKGAENADALLEEQAQRGRADDAQSAIAARLDRRAEGRRASAVRPGPAGRRGAVPATRAGDRVARAAASVLRRARGAQDSRHRRRRETARDQAGRHRRRRHHGRRHLHELRQYRRAGHRARRVARQSRHRACPHAQELRALGQPRQPESGAGGPAARLDHADARRRPSSATPISSSRRCSRTWR